MSTRKLPEAVQRQAFEGLAGPRLLIGACLRIGRAGAGLEDAYWSRDGASSLKGCRGARVGGGV